MYTDQEFYDAQKALPEFATWPADIFYFPIIEPLSPVIKNSPFPSGGTGHSIRTIVFRKNFRLRVWEEYYSPLSPFLKNAIEDIVNP